MNKLQKAVIVVFFLMFTVMVSVGLIRECEGVAFADEPAVSMEKKVFDAVRTLQPIHEPMVAVSWAAVIHAASVENELDPLLVTAIAFRESSLLPSVSDGPLGEQGIMQVHGIARRHRPPGCSVREIGCNIRTGAAFLAWVRQHCGGPWSVWVGGYGMSRCPSISEAEMLPSVRRARSIYERIGGTEWR